MTDKLISHPLTWLIGITFLGLVVGTYFGIALVIVLVVNFGWVTFIGLGNTTTIVSFIQLVVLLTILGAILGNVIGGIIGSILGFCTTVLGFVIKRLWGQVGAVRPRSL